MKVYYLKIIILIISQILFLSISSICQNLTFDDFVNIKELKDSELLLYKSGLRNIEKKSRYIFIECERCDTNFVECDWKCTSHIRTIYSDFNREDLELKNYTKQKNTSSNFAKNYNSKTKKAEIFITVKEFEECNNFNCNNELVILPKKINIEIQYNNINEFSLLMSSIIENAEYVETKTLVENTTTAIYRYKTGKTFIKYKNNYFDSGIYFYITEFDSYNIVEIKYKYIFWDD